MRPKHVVITLLIFSILMPAASAQTFFHAEGVIDTRTGRGHAAAEFVSVPRPPAVSQSGHVSITVQHRLVEVRDVILAKPGRISFRAPARRLPETQFRLPSVRLSTLEERFPKCCFC